MYLSIVFKNDQILSATVDLTEEKLFFDTAE